MYGKGKKLNQPKIQKQYEENIIINTRNFFILKKENREIKDRKTK